jgi:small-conductance mechanosensitive channel
MNLSEYTFYGNSLVRWGIALLVLVALRVLLAIARRLVLGRLKAFAARTSTMVDDLVVDLLQRTGYLFLTFIWLRLLPLVLTLPETVTDKLVTVGFLALLGQVLIWGSGLISYLVDRHKERALERDPADATAISALGLVGKLIFYSLILLLALDNLGVNITTLVAGLGISGIAVALAAQNILGDLFASLSIVFDKPFVLGDFVIIGDYMGTVEKIGLKTTRVRSLSGEQIIFSNTDLLNSRIRNYKRMFERRIAFSFGVVYQTPHEKLARIPAMVQEIIEKQENTRFDRAHFRQFGDSSLDFEAVYYVLVPDYNVYMDLQQTINLTLFKRFEEEAIEFAYPTRTLHVVRNGQPQAAETADPGGVQTMTPKV